MSSMTCRFLCVTLFIIVVIVIVLMVDLKHDDHFINSIKSSNSVFKQKFLYSSNQVRFDEENVTEVMSIKQQVCDCGQANYFKIVGGTETLANQFPWMVYLVISKNNSTQFCGGFLVSKRHVITAAHCVTNVSDDMVLAVVGVHNRSLTTEFKFRSERIAVHPQFNKPVRNNNDVAVITLLEEVPLSSRIGTVCLPGCEDLVENYTDRIVTVAGWGKDGADIDDRTSDVLKQVQVSIVDNIDCRKIYADISVPITTNMMCAKAPHGGKDSCQGDSGSPLVIEMHGGRYFVIGIVSFGFNCGSNRYPGVYTKVDRMFEFIETNTQNGISLICNRLIRDINRCNVTEIK